MTDCTAYRVASILVFATLVTGAVLIGPTGKAKAPENQEMPVQIAPVEPHESPAVDDALVAAATEEEHAAELAAKREHHLQEVSRAGLPVLVTRRIDTRSFVSPAQLDAVFAGTGLSGLGASFVQAEEIYGINAIILSSIAALESGWGSSDYAQERHNLFGYGAYTDAPEEAVEFADKHASIMAAARTLREAYIDNPDRQAGTLEEIGAIWATDDWSDGDPSWAWKVADTASGIAVRIQEAADGE